MTILTADEEREFTPFNAGAFDLDRKAASQRGEIITAWLATSAAERSASRRRLCTFLRQTVTGFFCYADEALERELNRLPSSEVRRMVAAWRAAELELKTQREAGNPTAYFVHELGQ